MDLRSNEPRNFRLYLQDELVRRCKANSRYSLRAFAKFLRVESSVLSKILSGKRSITRKTFELFCERLSLSPGVINQFRDSVNDRRGRKHTAHESPSARQDYQQMATDHFAVVSDWYHFAILELIQLNSFQGHVRWISQALGITQAETKSAIERLQRVGFLEIDQSGWHDRAGSITNIKPGFTSSAVAKVQAQWLDKSKTALEEVDLERRDHTGMTMAIDESLIPEAKRRIAIFRRELCALLQKSPKKESVYQLSLSLFPLTKMEK